MIMSYSCATCSKVYSHQSSLSRHVRQSHPGESDKTVEQYAVISADIGIILCYGKSYV